MDTGKVSGEIGTIPDHREVIGTPREVYGPYWALVEKRGKEQGGEAGRPLGRAKEGGVLLLVGVGLPFPSPTRKRGGKEREGEGEGKRGCAPLP